MTMLEAIDARHSFRAYKDTPIAADLRDRLNEYAAACNAESGLHIEIRYDDPSGFDSRLAHYGSFRNVSNYIVLAGRKDADFDFRCGYYGEKLVLFAQQLGLNTCWAALTFNKKHVTQLIRPGDALCMVVALGYGQTQGVQHRSKRFAEVCAETSELPDWFRAGVEAALKAPTAVNQQKFFFALDNGEAVARVKGLGTYTRVDLGIAACHFELASGIKPTIK